MNALLVALISFAGVSATALVTWFASRRQRSGRIDTTEAATLWNESQVMRQELRDETVRLRSEVLEMRTEAISMREETIALRDEVTQMRDEAAACRAEVVRLRRQLAATRRRQQ